MPTCQLCKTAFPNYMVIEGKKRNLKNRRYCVGCSPFGKHNTRTLTKAALEAETGFRECIRCLKVLPLADFKQRSKNGNLRPTCIVCTKKDWMQSRQKCMREKIEKIIQIHGTECQKCGREGPYPIFDFHHLHGKDLTISRLLDYGWPRIEAELSKCIMLCACCHRTKHYDETPPNSRTAKNRERKEALIHHAGGRCKTCDWHGCPAAFDFHHRDPETKSFIISQRPDCPLETLLPEVAKCDLLCACCHRLEHVTILV